MSSPTASQLRFCYKIARHSGSTPTASISACRRILGKCRRKYVGGAYADCVMRGVTSVLKKHIEKQK